MSGDKRHMGLPRGSDQILRARQSVARKLPHPQHTWTLDDVPDEMGDHITKFAQAGIVSKVEERYYAGTKSAVWTTNAAAWEYINECIDAPKAGPCEHSGIRNLGDGEFTCTNDDCSKTFGRDVAKARF